MNELKELMKSEIAKEINSLKEMKPGTEEYNATVDNIVKLIPQFTEIEKSDSRKNEVIDQWIKNGIAIAGIVIPSAITIWGVVVSLKFEETQSLTTTIGRGFINKLVSKR